MVTVFAYFVFGIIGFCIALVVLTGLSAMLMVAYSAVVGFASLFITRRKF